LIQTQEKKFQKLKEKAHLVPLAGKERARNELNNSPGQKRRVNKSRFKEGKKWKEKGKYNGRNNASLYSRYTLPKIFKIDVSTNVITIEPPPPGVVKQEFR
jgi:hypothetical protein